MSWLALVALLFLLFVLLAETAAHVHRTTASTAAPRCATICCPGGGVYFWWQIGAMHELLSMYDLPDDVKLSGASAGALACVFGQCRVDPGAAHRVAFALADEAGCLRNPLGLCGKWGRLVHAWLDELLPDDAADRCSGRCRLVVTRFAPLPQPAGLTAFARRDELINALMASTHIPFFMDGRPTSRHVRGAADGGVLAWLGLTSSLALLCPEASDRPAAIVIDHKRDAPFRAACRARGWSALSTRGTEEFASFGAEWVRREAGRGADGHLAPLAPYRRPYVRALGGAVAAPPRAGGGARPRRSPSRRNK